VLLSSVEGGSDGLDVLHHRLETRFRTLRERRDALGKGTPLFALEHGLSEAELILLRAEVRASVQGRRLPRKSWLPFVVYAAEVGYEYCGDEYWQSFASQTPGWAEFGDRDYIRRKFRQFSDLFGGAVPGGAWARHFSIISWPITHAVLPTDLQRQLARLLFEYRTALTSDLLGDPNGLGSKLAARSWHYSSRFQNFAQNTKLLGQVAAALLTGDDEESPYLLDTTLKRIVETLSVEREARGWLRDAKSSASRVRTRGFRAPNLRPTGPSETPGATRLPSATDPGIFLRRMPDGWAAYLDLPDLSVLAERLPGIHRALGRLRAQIAGVTRPPLARGQLLYPGQEVRLDQWPDPRSPLVQLENGSPEVNRMLGDQCMLSRGPRWLFRLREPALAVEVRGTFVRPGHNYVLISKTALETERQPWVTPVACKTAGVHALSVEVPALLEPEHLEQIRSLGLAAVSDVAVRPAGVVPAGWDGEGAAEWIVGEEAVIAVQSTSAVAQCIFSVDGVPHLLAWPQGDEEIFVALGNLEIGSHDVQVSLLPPDVDEPLAEGSLLVAVRSPHSRPPSGTSREGLMIIAAPANPTLPELWDGKASLQLLGPPGIRVSIEVSLTDKNNNVLARETFGVASPLDPSAWLKHLARDVRRSNRIASVYDVAEACDITASHPSLGTARIRCEREFAPLRWAAGRDRDGPYVRLINNTEGGLVTVERFEFATPDRPTQLDTVSGNLRWPAGGLIKATAGDFESSVILPPFVRHLAHLQSPHVSAGPRTVNEVTRLIELARLWTSASAPADPFADERRHAVLQAITIRVVTLVGGHRWAHTEDRVARGDDRFTIGELAQAVGEETYQRALARALQAELHHWRTVAPVRRSERFADILVEHVHLHGVGRAEQRFAEFLLRLASDPASVGRWPEAPSWLDLAFVSPALVRAARFLVLAIHLVEDEDGATYRGWAWT